MADTIEVITGRERRRRWSTEEKLRLVAASHEAGACVKQVAASHDVTPGLLFGWRRQVREGKLTRSPTTMFLPVRALAADDAPVQRAEPRERPVPRPAGQIEIELKDGSRVRVDPDVSLVALRRVITVLRE